MNSQWLPALVLPPVLIIDAAISAVGHPLTAINVLSAFVACAPLALRRRIPVWALLALVVGGIVLVLWRLHPANTVVVIPMTMLFALACEGHRRQSMILAVVTVPCVFISVLPFAPDSQLASLVIRNLALCLLAIAGGEIKRSQRLSRQRLVEAAEQQTLRRVGEERLEIAREIHDTVAHAMTAINVQAGVAAHLLERDPGQAFDALRNIKATSGQALSDLRATLDVLRDPAQQAPLGPSSQLGDIAPLTAGLRSAGVDVEVSVEAVDDVPAPVQAAGYRIIQEALTNVARHSRASRAQVSVTRQAGGLAIEVVDDGAGANGGHDPGNGLRGMGERAAALGGTFEAAPGPGGGWRVKALLPMSRAS